MGKANFSDEFKRDAVAQITERGYPVAEVSQRLGVSQHSLYAWKRQLGRQVSSDASKDAEFVLPDYWKQNNSYEYVAASIVEHLESNDSTLKTEHHISKSVKETEAAVLREGRGVPSLGEGASLWKDGRQP